MLTHTHAYHDRGQEADGHWEHLLHLVLAEFGRRSGQVAAQAFNPVHDLFL